MSPHTSTAPASLKLQSRVPSLRGRRVSAILTLLVLAPFPFLDVASCQGGANETYTGLSLFTQSWELSVAWPLAISVMLSLAAFSTHWRRPIVRVLLALFDVVAVAGLHLCVFAALLSAALFEEATPRLPGLFAYTVLWVLTADVVVTLVVRLARAVRARLRDGRTRPPPRDLEQPPGHASP